MNEEEPRVELVIDDNPAWIGWDFIGDLWKLDQKVAEFKAEDVLEKLKLATLDGPPLEAAVG